MMTIHDDAQVAGVSSATVFRVIRWHSYVHPDVQERAPMTSHAAIGGDAMSRMSSAGADAAARGP
jgi:Bacterial regulatory proteins, lacI family